MLPSEDPVYVGIAAIVAAYAGISVFYPLLAPPCDIAPPKTTYQNLDYVHDGCKWRRCPHHACLKLSGQYHASVLHCYVIDHGPYEWEPILLYMSTWEADMCRRMFVSLVLGSLVGRERQRRVRNAGMRHLGMICLGSCAFTIGGVFCEITGPQSWDPARVAAAVPAGVGFLGAASIFKGSEQPEVHGLVSAVSVWLSAAVGIMSGGALYVSAVFVVLGAMIFLRFAAPRSLTDGTAAKTNDDSDANVIASGLELRPTLEHHKLSAIRLGWIGEFSTGATLPRSQHRQLFSQCVWLRLGHEGCGKKCNCL
eukprot:1632124-Pleurochrysis_carterae.AAC.3